MSFTDALAVLLIYFAVLCVIMVISDDWLPVLLWALVLSAPIASLAAASLITVVYNKGDK